MTVDRCRPDHTESGLRHSAPGWYHSRSGRLSKLAILKELSGFLRTRKKWWLTPIIVLLVLLGALIVLTEGSALAPFIYALF